MTTTLENMTTTEIVLKMIFDRWNTSIKNCDTTINSLSDEQLEMEIAPGKNRGKYVFGHLIAVHDEMLNLLDMGPKMFPELYEPFLKMPDRATEKIPSVGELRKFWTSQCEMMKQKFDGVKPEEWFQRHTAVSAEDFVNEPHRNKLNIIVTRTTHLQYHVGQLVLLKDR